MVERRASCRVDRGGTCVVPPPHYDEGMFFLTRREQIVMSLILIALLGGAGIRHVRQDRLIPQENAARIAAPR